MHVILIDDQLRQAGWEPVDKTQVLAEQYVSDVGRATSTLHEPGSEIPRSWSRDEGEIPP